MTRPPFVHLAILVALLLSPLKVGSAQPRSAPGPGIAQGRYGFQNYGIQDGLGNLSVLVVHQDRIGFLWAGTEDGLYRFDGQKFQMYGTAEGLPSSYIIDMVEGDAGHLWVGTFSGLAVQDGDRFKALGADSGLPQGQVQDLAVNNGRLTVAYQKGLFQEIAPGGDTFAQVPGWPGGDAVAVGTINGQSRIWAASYDGRKAKVLSLDKGTWQEWNGSEGFGKEHIDAVQPDSTGTVWARDAHNLWELAPGTTRFEKLVPGIPSISARAVIRVGVDGTMYVPTDKGLWIRSDGGWTSIGEQSGLISGRVRDAVKDREGSLWISGSGVSRLLGRGLWRSYTTQEGLSDNVVWTIFRSRKGDLYIGTDRGLSIAGPKGFKSIPATGGYVVRTAVEAADGTFYLGTLPARVVHWDPRSGRVEAVYGTESGLRGKRLFRLLLDEQGQLWASTEDSGLFRADTKAKSLHFNRVALPGGTPGEYINGLTQGRSGRIYASGECGLAILDHGQWRRYTAHDGLKNNFTSYAVELNNGEVLVGYFESAGLSRMKPTPSGSFVTIPPGPLDAALSREKVYMVGGDDKGNAWVGTGRGVFLSQGDSVQHFRLADGLISEDSDNMAFLADHDGDVWVGTSGGLAEFDSKAFQGAADPPPTVFLSCAFGTKGVDLEGAPPKISYRDNTLTANFAGLSFLGGNLIEHQVRLSGLENEWHPSDIGEARYPALAPGDYSLQVRSRVMHGEWGQAASFSFKVLPAWWQSWWFRSLIVLATGFALVGILRWRLAALRRHNAELEELVLVRTVELESANELLQAQSVTDSLTGLKNRRYLSACMPEDVARVRRVHRELRGDRRDRAHLNIDLVLIMVDLDHFKIVNDTYGHAAGDLVLQQVAEILRDCIRDMDTVVRWGGEEFLIVARNAARAEAVVLVERIRSRIDGHAFDLGDGVTIQRTCSIGFGYLPFICAEPEFMDWEEVVDIADHCLYVAKENGRNAWVGIVAGLEVTAEQLGPKVSKRLPELLDASLVYVLTSHPDPSSLNWKNISTPD